MDALLDPTNLLALLTLTLLEIVLGIDNVVFIAIITDSLPPERRNFARRLGLGLALFGRVALVLGVSWLLTLEHPLFTVLEHEITISGLILIGGGLFLLYKAVREIFNTTELHEEEHGEVKQRASVAGRDRADRRHRHDLRHRLGAHRRRHDERDRCSSSWPSPSPSP